MPDLLASRSKLPAGGGDFTLPRLTLGVFLNGHASQAMPQMLENGTQFDFYDHPQDARWAADTRSGRRFHGDPPDR